MATGIDGRIGFSLSAFDFLRRWDRSNPDSLKPILLARHNADAIPIFLGAGNALFRAWKFLVW